MALWILIAECYVGRNTQAHHEHRRGAELTSDVIPTYKYLYGPGITWVEDKIREHNSSGLQF